MLVVHHVGSLQVMAVHSLSGGCGFHHCTAWSSSVGSWVAVATQEGKVQVVRVCELRTGGGGEGESVTKLSLGKSVSLLESQSQLCACSRV